MEEAIVVLEKRVAIDRALRDGSVESDYDKFCENECLAIEKLINGYRELEEENEDLKNDLHHDGLAHKYLTLKATSIPKSKIKEFFTSRLEKYQEADDGAYEQDYLTRGELELVDRYKECKEIAKILLEEEIKAEIPQDCIPKSKIKEKIEELNKEERGLRNSISAEEYAEYSDANISFDLMHIEIQRSVLQELMEDK